MTGVLHVWRLNGGEVSCLRGGGHRDGAKAGIAVRMLPKLMQMKTWLALAGIGLLLGSPALANAATVLSVGDGDTLTVSDEGRRVTVRLACIDAPETAQAPYGAKARATLQALAPVGSTVAIQASKKDRYGRTIAEVLRGRTNVNLELVRRGDAFVYRQYLSGCDRNAYLSAEKQAEAARSGVWSVAGGITRPWDWRRGGGGRSLRELEVTAGKRSGQR